MRAAGLSSRMERLCAGRRRRRRWKLKAGLCPWEIDRATGDAPAGPGTHGELPAALQSEKSHGLQQLHPTHISARGRRQIPKAAHHWGHAALGVVGCNPPAFCWDAALKRRCAWREQQQRMGPFFWGSQVLELQGVKGATRAQRWVLQQYC